MDEDNLTALIFMMMHLPLMTTAPAELVEKTLIRVNPKVLTVHK